MEKYLPRKLNEGSMPKKMKKKKGVMKKGVKKKTLGGIERKSKKMGKMSRKVHKPMKRIPRASSRMGNREIPKGRAFSN